MSDAAIRVFVVDDHRLFLSGVRSELGRAFAIVGDAESVDAAVEGIVRTSPDVVVVDVHMPDGGGAVVIEGVRAAGGKARFLALSVSDAAEDVIGVIRAGARGYVTKTIAPDELVDAIRRIHEGDAVFSPLLAGFVLDAFAGSPPPGALDPDIEQLTPREREVLRLIARGYSYRDVGGELFISIKTVESHVSSPATESSIRGQQTLRELAYRDHHAAGRATSHPGCLSTHPRSSACAVGPERAPDDATPRTPLGPTGSLSGRPFRPAITDDVGAKKATGAAAIAMRAVDDRPERKPVRTTFQVSVTAPRRGIARWSGFGSRPSGGQRRYARRRWSNA